MTILIVTNRVLNEKPSSPEFLFGETLNAKGGCEIRLATFDKNPDGTWRGDLIEEADEPTVDNVPSREKFRELRGRLINDEKDCVFYVHGYNKSFAESLEQCWEIQERYGVEVVGFSWPADPAGVSPFDYFQARRVAASSAPALDLVLEKMGRYFRECLSEEPSGSAQCGVSFNLVIHSLGAFLFETFVRSGDFSGETRFFDNIVLNAADVDNPDHKSWIDKLQFVPRLYVTLNEQDMVLAASDIVNRDRLGNTARDLLAQRPYYVDFTGADHVGKAHRLFAEVPENPRVEAFFDLAFHGRAAERLPGIERDDENNVYVFQPDRYVGADSDDGERMDR